MGVANHWVRNSTNHLGLAQSFTANHRGPAFIAPDQKAIHQLLDPSGTLAVINPESERNMSLAEKLCISAAFLFFMTGLLTGIWKYWCMATSPKAAAPRYVDIAHRSSLMYSFAAVLLGWFASYSVYPDWLNTLAAASALGFFALAIGTYIIHGVLRDTSNQLRKPHRLGNATLPAWMIHGFMGLLILAEVGGSLVLGLGALQGVW